MVCIVNLSPSLYPPQPSLNNGPVQRRVRRAFVATEQSVLSTTHTNLGGKTVMIESPSALTVLLS